MDSFVRYYKSPWGWLAVTCNATGLTGIKSVEDKGEEKKHALLDAACRQLDEYFSRKRQEFILPIAPKGSEFSLRVWKELQKISYGQVMSYKEIAEKCQAINAARAIGRACHDNPLPIIVPCHRVVGASGQLTGYVYGLDVKRYLLALERDNVR